MYQNLWGYKEKRGSSLAWDFSVRWIIFTPFPFVIEHFVLRNI